jgi:hypothetical protein
MSRHPFALWFVSAVNAVAQPAAPTPAASVPPIRAVSPATADLLKSALPKSAFVKPAEKKPGIVAPGLRDADQPPGEIVSLPNYVVRESKAPDFTERDLHTPKGLQAVAMHRYFKEADRALNHFMLPLFAPISTKGTSNEVRGMTMYEDDERLKNLSEMADRTNMVLRSDAAAGSKVKKEAQQTFMRWQDMGWQGGGKK